MPEMVDSSLVLEGFISVRRDRLLYQKNHVHDYIVIQSRPESVAIIAKNANGDILVTQEYRHPVQKIVYGCPGGLVDSGEGPLDAAKRELLEETGCQAKTLSLLNTVYPLPGMLDQKMHIVLALDVHFQQKALPEVTELISAKFIPRESLHTIMQQQDVDGILCTALYQLMLHETRALS